MKSTLPVREPLAGPAKLEFDGERFIPGGIESEIDLEHLHRYLSASLLLQGEVVVDVASGAGYGSAILAKTAKQVTGFDVSDLAVASARENFSAPNLRFEVGDCTNLPLEDGVVDTLVSFETIEHITQHDRFLDECRRVLRPGGRLIISTPDRARYNAQLAEPNEHHLKELSEEEFRHLLQQRFRNVRISGQRVVFGSMILPESRVDELETLRRANSSSIEREGAYERSIYLVAVCSDEHVEPFPAGIYEGSFPPNALSSLIGGVKDRDAIARDLRVEMHETRLNLSRDVERLSKERENLASDLNKMTQLADAERREGERLQLEIKVLSAKLQDSIWMAEEQDLEIRKISAERQLAEETLRRSRFIGARAANVFWRKMRRSPMLALPFDLLVFFLKSGLRPRRALQLAMWAHTIRKSGVFDEVFYVGAYFDVRVTQMDPVRHYIRHGAGEGRDPSQSFSTQAYIGLHSDVKSSGINPLYHYLRYGPGEKRSTGPVRQVATFQASTEEGERPIPTPRARSFDPYTVRPDDVIREEIDLGETFLNRYDLTGDRADIVGAFNRLRSIEPSASIATALNHRAPDVSVIVPIYGQLPYTLNCLASLARHASRHTFEVIVVDDCSPDDSKSWLSSLPWIQLVHQAENQGFLKTCNNAGEVARGAHIVLLNNDTRVVDGWLDELIDSFRSFPRAGLVGSKFYYPDGSLQEAGGIIWRDGSAWNFGRNDDPNRPEYCYARQVDYVSGASIAMPTEVWRRLGGFDESYRPAYCEDSDLAFRVRQAGMEVWMQPLSRVIHYEGKSSGTDTSKGVKAHQVTNSRKLFDRWRSVLERHRRNGEEPMLEKDRATKGRVLVIDVSTPTPDQDAGSVTTVMNLKIFAELGYKTHFVPAGNFLFMRPYTADLQRLGIECHYAPFELGLEEHLKRYGSTYDFIKVFRSSVAHKVLPLLRKYAPQAPVAFNNMDLHYLRMSRQAEVQADAALMAEAETMKQLEFGVIQAVDCTVVPSLEEAAILRRDLPNSPVVVLPYMTELVGTTAPFASRKDFVFVGGFAHIPNVDAVVYFVAEIWPLIRQRAPDARFYIVGSNPPQEVLDLASDDVIVTGRVDRLEPYFDRSRVCVCPIRFGAGVKGKVTTAMAHGVPVVATTIAAEGMGVEHGRDLLIADSPNDFAEAALKLYSGEALWSQLSAQAFDFANEHNSTKMGLRVMNDIVATAKATHKARRLQLA